MDTSTNEQEWEPRNKRIQVRSMDFQQRCQEHTTTVSSAHSSENWVSTCRRTKEDLYAIVYIKFSWRFRQVRNCKTIRKQSEKTHMTLVWAMICFFNQYFIQYSTRNTKTKIKQTQIQIDKRYYIKLKSFFTEKKI